MVGLKKVSLLEQRQLLLLAVGFLSVFGLKSANSNLPPLGYYIDILVRSEYESGINHLYGCQNLVMDRFRLRDHEAKWILYSEIYLLLRL